MKKIERMKLKNREMLERIRRNTFNSLDKGGDGFGNRVANKARKPVEDIIKSWT